MLLLLLFPLLVMASIIPTTAEVICCQPLVKSDYAVDYIGKYNPLKYKNGTQVIKNERPVFESEDKAWYLWYNLNWKIWKNDSLYKENNPLGRMYLYNTAYCPDNLARWYGWVHDYGMQEVGSVTCA